MFGEVHNEDEDTAVVAQMLCRSWRRKGFRHRCEVRSNLKIGRSSSERSRRKD